MPVGHAAWYKRVTETKAEMLCNFVPPYSKAVELAETFLRPACTRFHVKGLYRVVQSLTTTGVEITAYLKAKDENARGRLLFLAFVKAAVKHCLVSFVQGMQGYSIKNSPYMICLLLGCDKMSLGPGGIIENDLKVGMLLVSYIVPAVVHTRRSRRSRGVGDMFPLQVSA